MHRGARIAVVVAGVAAIVIVIVGVVLVEHLDDGTASATKRVAPEQLEHFDTIVVLQPDASGLAVGDLEDRMNRLDAVQQFAEVPHNTLAYLLSLDDDAGTKSFVDQSCSQPQMRGYVVALTKPADSARRKLSDALGRDASVLASKYKPPQPEIFMEVRATDEQTRAVKDRLDVDSDVRSYRFLDHNDAYAEFKRLFADQPVLTESETPEGLPESFRLALREGAKPAAVAGRFRAMPGVNDVVVPTQTVLPKAPIDVCEFPR